MFKNKRLFLNMTFNKIQTYDDRKNGCDFMNSSNEIIYPVRFGDTLYNLARKYGTAIETIIEKNPNINFHNIAVGEKIVIPVNSAAAGGNPKYSMMDLRNALRQLWEQHVAWTRMTIISAAFGNPDLSPTVNRLLRNASNMGNALKPFYGQENAAKFENLIREHLNIALQLVLASKAGETQKAEEAEKEWYKNGDEIARFLSSINPYINEESFKKMFYDHLAMTKAEAVARLNKEYPKDIALYDQIENQALLMADTISNGIIKQFPQLF